MKTIGLMMRHNLKMFFKNPFFILLLLAPIGVNLFCSYFLELQQTNALATVLIYEDNKNSIISELGEELEGRGINLTSMKSQEELELNMKEGKGDLGVIFYSMNHIELFMDEERSMGEFAKSQLENVLKLNQTDLKANGKWYITETTNKQPIEALLVSFGIFVMLFLFTCIKSLEPMVKERVNTVYRRIGVSGVRHYEYLLGHILGCFIILMFQSLIQCFAMLVFQVNFSLNFFQLLSICIVLAMIGITIGFIIYNCVENSHTYFIIATFIITPLCMLSNCIFPITLLPETIQKVSYFSPLRWLMAAYEQMIIGNSWREIGSGLMIASLMSIALFLMGLWWQTNHSKEVW